MARYTFGGTTADFVFSHQQLAGRSTVVVAPARVTFWSAASGGTRYTDLVVDGTPAAEVYTDATGHLPVFSGPDGVTELWADAGGTRTRLVLAPLDAVVAADTAVIQAQSAKALAESAATAAQDAADLAVDISGIDTTDDAVDAALKLPGSKSAETLNAATANQVKRVAVGPPAARGAVVFTWDDGYPSWKNRIVPLAEELGQKHVFCITTNRIDDPTWDMSSQDIADWHAAGHEIASHSHTHARMGDLSVVDRTYEYEHSKELLEAIVGEGEATSFVYPYGSSGGARNVASDEALRFRYERVHDTGVLGQYPMGERSPVLINRRGWGATGRETTLEMIRLAAVRPVIVIFYGHAVTEDPIPPETFPPNQPPWAHVEEAMRLCHELGVPVITSKEAFPVTEALMNGSAETGDLGGWNIQNASAVDVVDVVTTTPATGLFGSKAFRHKKTEATTGALAQKQIVPVTPGKTYVLTARMKVVQGPLGTNTGAWAARLRIETLKGAALQDFATAAQTVTPAEADYGTWITRSTTPWACPTDVYAVQVSTVTQIGTTSLAPLPEVLYDHITFDEVPYAPAGGGGGEAPGNVRVDVITAGSSTWTKPAGAKSIAVTCIAPGSGGGAGARGPAGTALIGGGGGAGGGVSTATFPAAAVANTVTVQVGAGGAGAPPQTTDSTAGANGSPAMSPTRFGNYLQAGRAAVAGAGGGLNTGGGAATSGGNGSWPGGPGASGGGGGAKGLSAVGTAGPGGGGAGGGISTSSVASDGSNGGQPVTQLSPVGTGGTVPGGTGGVGGSIAGQLGAGGGGGGASTTGAGGKGGDGGTYGAGGGGGGASLNGQPSGGGGNGAQGVCIVTTYF